MELMKGILIQQESIINQLKTAEHGVRNEYQVHFTSPQHAFYRSLSSIFCTTGCSNISPTFRVFPRHFFTLLQSSSPFLDGEKELHADARHAPHGRAAPVGSTAAARRHGARRERSVEAQPGTAEPLRRALQAVRGGEESQVSFDASFCCFLFLFL